MFYKWSCLACFLNAQRKWTLVSDFFINYVWPLGDFQVIRHEPHMPAQNNLVCSRSTMLIELFQINAIVHSQSTHTPVVQVLISTKSTWHPQTTRVWVWFGCLWTNPLNHSLLVCKIVCELRVVPNFLVRLCTDSNQLAQAIGIGVDLHQTFPLNWYTLTCVFKSAENI